MHGSNSCPKRLVVCLDGDFRSEARLTKGGASFDLVGNWGSGVGFTFDPIGGPQEGRAAGAMADVRGVVGGGGRLGKDSEQMEATLRELADLVGGRVTGDGNLKIRGAAILRDALPGDITLADKPKYAATLASTQASAVVVPEHFQPAGIPTITVADVHGAFARIVRLFRPAQPRSPHGVSPDAVIHPTARIGARVTIHAGASVGEGVEIGDECVIHAGVRLLAGCRLGQQVVIFPNAVLYEDTRVGDRSIIHASAVLGAYGFGYDSSAGRHRLSAQIGYVEIGADVEIGACSTIDRGTYGPTSIGEGTKIDNQVMIAHNCRIGRHNLLCSHVGVAGSCTTGDYVVLAGQVGVRDHVNIGDRVIVGAQSGITCDLASDSHYLGSPAIPERDEIRIMAARSKLLELRKQIKMLERAVEELQAHPAQSSLTAQSPLTAQGSLAAQVSLVNSSNAETQDAA